MNIHGISRYNDEKVKKNENDATKMWYPINEALKVLGIEESIFWKKMIALNIEARPLPGEKGQYISLHDLNILLNLIKGPK